MANENKPDVRDMGEPCIRCGGSCEKHFCDTYQDRNDWQAHETDAEPCARCAEWGGDQYPGKEHIAALEAENARLIAQAEGLKQINIENTKTFEVEIKRLSRESSACDLLEEYRQDAQTTADALGHIQQQFEMVTNDRDDWIACHAKIFRELQETKTLLANKCAEVERLKAVP